jgi:hypothetical protein
MNSARSASVNPIMFGSPAEGAGSVQIQRH